MPIDKLCDVSERREYVFPVALELTEKFAAGVSANLAFDPHRNRKDGSHLYITTLYFDSSDHAIARACENQLDNIKLRAREYHDRGAGLDTGPEPLLWLEVKARTGARTRKLRLSVPTGEVGGLLREGAVDSWLLHLHEHDALAANEAMLRELVELCGEAEGPLRPACIAHYRRRAWQDASGSTRVTLDTELTFYRARPEFFTHYTTLSEALDQPVLQAEHGVIEIKLRGECPDWLDELLTPLGIELGPNTNIQYSKFLAASAAVAGT
jgi:hypothetical protein